MLQQIFNLYSKIVEGKKSISVFNLISTFHDLKKEDKRKINLRTLLVFLLGYSCKRRLRPQVYINIFLSTLLAHHNQLGGRLAKQVEILCGCILAKEMTCCSAVILHVCKYLYIDRFKKHNRECSALMFTD